MQRISRLKRSEVRPSSVEIYDRTLRDRGNVPNMFRTMAHRPEIFETIIAHMDAVLNTGTLSKKLKELVIVRTSQCNRTPYCLASHTAICKRLGWTDTDLEALKDADHASFTDAEKAAVHLAEVMTLRPHDYTDAEFRQLRSFYSEGEVVELMAAIGLFNYFNRFNDVLLMEPTQPATAEELAEAGVELAAR
ncbi:MAG TPA: peroxidase-related enzyme [Acidobacteriaceae bacterium]|nr:peroxidase-related enzyme [Acidobacteriaceae bacterium]